MIYTLGGPARSHFVERFQSTPVELLTAPLVVASAASAVLMSIASCIGAYALARAREWRRLSLVTVPLLYMLIIGSGQEAWARFRVPLEPLLAILAAMGVLHIHKVISRRKATLRRSS